MSEVLKETEIDTWPTGKKLLNLYYLYPYQPLTSLPFGEKISVHSESILDLKNLTPAAVYYLCNRFDMHVPFDMTSEKMENDVVVQKYMNNEKMVERFSTTLDDLQNCFRTFNKYSKEENWGKTCVTCIPGSKETTGEPKGFSRLIQTILFQMNDNNFSYDSLLKRVVKREPMHTNRDKRTTVLEHLTLICKDVPYGSVLIVDDICTSGTSMFASGKLIEGKMKLHYNTDYGYSSKLKDKCLHYFAVGRTTRKEESTEE